MNAPPLPAPGPATLTPYWKGGIAGASLLLFLIACALPAASMENGAVWPGGQLLLLGALGALFGQFAWYANLLYFLAIVFVALGWLRVALVVSFGQILLTLDMLTFPGTEILLDEGGVNKTRVVALMPGAWVWLAALAVPAVGLIVAPRALGAGTGREYGQGAALDPQGGSGPLDPVL